MDLRLLGLFSVLVTSAFGSALPHAAERTVLSLNGKWAYIVDPYDTGYLDYRGQPYDAQLPPTGGYFLDRVAASPSDLIEYQFNPEITLTVPRDWNTQYEKLFYYEGTVWYRRLFDAPPPRADARYFIQFGAANYEADVYLNGKKLGQHVGGFTPFGFEVTALLRAENNSLVVRVNNTRHADAVPTVNTDWWNYGGLTRDIRLLAVPETYIAHDSIQLSPGAPHPVHVEVQLAGAHLSQAIRVSVPELQFNALLHTNSTGDAVADLDIPGLERWSPEHPKLYAVDVVAESDAVHDRVGFRTIETRGADILLNGKPIFLRGICLHEENPLRGGRAATREDAALLLSWVKDLHCNFARLAHYPHNEYMAELADELGILLWEEIPVYWTIQWDNPKTLAVARQQLAELIERDHNRASVVVWSMANETPVGPARTRFLKQLVDDARALDGTRLISAAMEVRRDPANPHVRIVDDPLGEFTDVCSFNEYIGWYDGLPELCPKVEWHIASQKPVVISEFGADALAGRHGTVEQRFTEEFQANLYRQTIPMLERIPNLRGMNPWVLVDFRSPRRPLYGVEDGWNRKGLIGENGARKQAFFVLRNYYDLRAR